MNLSGIVVTTTPAHLRRVAAALADLPGVEVHQTDEASARIVVVQEARDVGAEIEGLQRIQALPHVVSAGLVYHYFEDPTAETERSP